MNHLAHIIRLVSFLLMSYLLPGHATVNVGIPFFKPPFVLSPAQGFDIDLVRIICQRLNESCHLIPMNFNKLFVALKTRQIDLAMGIVVTPERKLQGYIFSSPYLLAQGQFLVVKNKPLPVINRTHKLNIGLIKAQNQGSAFYLKLAKRYPNFNFVQFDDMEDLITSLTSGHINAGFMYKESVDYWRHNGGNQFEKLGMPVMIGEGTAIMALADKSVLINHINAIINSLQTEQAYLNLYAIYFVEHQ